MIYLGICDDDSSVRDELKSICEDFFKEMGTEVTCLLFVSSEELLRYKGPQLTLLFLDIELPGMSGLEVMKAAALSKMVWRIVFVTSHHELVYDAFGLLTLGFVTKPIQKEKIIKWVRVAVEEEANNKKYCIETEKGIVRVSQNEILYLEAAGNYVYLHTDTQKYLLSGNLKKWDEVFSGESFYRCHKSYTVSIRKVQRIMASEVEMSDGTVIPIGRVRRGELLRRYRVYIAESGLRRI